MSDSKKPKAYIRHDGWTVEKRAQFVEALAAAGNVRDACRAAGLSNQAAYRLRRRDAGFATQWDAALAQSATKLEAVAYARAVEGVEEPVFQNGKLVGTRVKTSDTLLRLLLQASNPEKYGRTGGQPSVQLREELEARVEEIKYDAYREAWKVFEGEYRYAMEPTYVRIQVMRRLHQINFRLCNKNPLCRECHPERYDREQWNWDHVTDPGEDHEPIDPGRLWIAYDNWLWTEEQAAANLASTSGRAEIDLPPKLPRLHEERGRPERTDEWHAANDAAKAAGRSELPWQRPGWIDPRKGKRKAATA